MILRERALEMKVLEKDRGRPIYRNKRAAEWVHEVLRESRQAVIPIYCIGEQDHDRRTL